MNAIISPIAGILSSLGLPVGFLVRGGRIRRSFFISYDISTSFSSFGGFTTPSYAAAHVAVLKQSPTNVV